MTEEIAARLLEISVVRTARRSWEWRLYAGDEIFDRGFESSHLVARYAVYDAMFGMLESGWS
jgi:hypothetical protein